uniref:Uncharacterized protein n=1 Tax=Mustela putorius furo TaxID=9669 RepID=M3Z862_MUSPF
MRSLGPRRGLALAHRPGPQQAHGRARRPGRLHHPRSRRPRGHRTRRHRGLCASTGCEAGQRDSLGAQPQARGGPGRGGPGPAGQQQGRRPGRGAPPGGASARATRKGVSEGAPRGRALLGRAGPAPPRPPSGCAAPLTRPPSRGSCRFHGYAPREVRAPQAVRRRPAPAGDGSDGTPSRAALSHAPRAPRTHPARTPHPAEHAPLTGAQAPRALTRPHPAPGAPLPRPAVNTRTTHTTHTTRPEPTRARTPAAPRLHSPAQPAEGRGRVRARAASWRTPPLCEPRRASTFWSLRGRAPS